MTRNIDTFRQIVRKNPDNALAQYSLGNEYLKRKDFDNAIIHLNKAVRLQHDYSAAWKLYAKALAENNQEKEAISAYQQGIKVAQNNGDQQAKKEMQIFLKRLKD